MALHGDAVLVAKALWVSILCCVNWPLVPYTWTVLFLCLLFCLPNAGWHKLLRVMRVAMVKTATSQNGDKPERRHLFRETNKITPNTFSKRTLRGINCSLFLLCYCSIFVCVSVKLKTQFSAFLVVFCTFNVFSHTQQSTSRPTTVLSS